MNNEELIEWVKANLQEVQELKDKVEITKKIREYDKYCYTLVGKVIKARREELHLSKRDLAELLYTNVQNVANYEAGKRVMSVQMLCKFCIALNIKLQLNGVEIK